MRYICLEPPESGSEYHSDYSTFVTDAKTLLAQLKAASNTDERKEIIDSNSKVWGNLKKWLLSLSHQKCWFSEAKDCFSHWDVEHFRPKKSVKDLNGTEHDGYWWLAFDWNNFRICGNAGNRKKGTYFPLRDESQRVISPDADLRYEDPWLLDPTNSEDPLLLSFDMEGRAIPNPHINDEWEKRRVTYSIKRYNLDFPPLIDKRKVIWQNCWQNIQAYLDELNKYHKDQTNGIARNNLQEKAKNIRNMLKADQELSSVACACLLSTGDKRLICFLQSR